MISCEVGKRLAHALKIIISRNITKIAKKQVRSFETQLIFVFISERGSNPFDATNIGVYSSQRAPSVYIFVGQFKNQNRREAVLGIAWKVDGASDGTRVFEESAIESIIRLPRVGFSATAPFQKTIKYSMTIAYCKRHSALIVYDPFWR